LSAGSATVPVAAHGVPPDALWFFSSPFGETRALPKLLSWFHSFIIE